MRTLFCAFIICAFVTTAALAADKKPAAKDKDKAEATEHAVSMKNVKYAPATLDIKVGDTVIWTNDDDHDHTVISADGSFKSEKIGRGETFKHTFDKKGKFKYSCSYHPRMKGTITVKE